MAKVTPFYGTKFSFSQNVLNWYKRRSWKFGDDLLIGFRAIAKKRKGGKNSSPSSAWVEMPYIIEKIAIILIRIKTFFFRSLVHWLIDWLIRSFIHFIYSLDHFLLNRLKGFVFIHLLFNYSFINPCSFCILGPVRSSEFGCLAHSKYERGRIFQTRTTYTGHSTCPVNLTRSSSSENRGSEDSWMPGLLSRN